MLTYKNLYTQVIEEVKKEIAFRRTNKYGDQTIRPSSVEPFGMSGTQTSDISAQELVRAVQSILNDALPSRIITGLNVTASTPLSAVVTISAGKGTIGGYVYELTEDTEITIPFNNANRCFYLHLYNDRILVDTTEDTRKLTVAKIIIPKPGVTDVVRDKDDGSYDAYIIQYKEYKLHGDDNGYLEEDSIEMLRNNIGDITADSLVGNIRLSENLKIINTQGTLELNSNSLLLKNFNGNTVAKFNRYGVNFFRDDGVELAKFTVDGARIGNIVVDPNCLKSDNFVSGSTGFQIKDDGNVEFNGLTVRGNVYATGGTIGGFTITSNKLYGGIIQTSASAGEGVNSVIMDSDGIRGYSALLGQVFDLPTDGSAPQFTAGVIEQTIIEVNTNAVIRTSSTVGDGSANSYGILINNTGIYGCAANQSLAQANFRVIAATGNAYFKGEIYATSGDIGGVTISASQLTGGKIIGATLRGGIIENSDSIPRVRIDTEGLSYQVSSSTGKYAEFKYDDGTKYGAGVLAYMFNTNYPVFAVLAQHNKADIRLYNRAAHPGSGEGAHALGDVMCIENYINYCVQAGSPGTFVPIGGILEARTSDPDNPQAGRIWIRTDI